MSSDCWMGATGMACVDEAKAKKTTVGISFLISLALPKENKLRLLA
jgi:hypothetical protein